MDFLTSDPHLFHEKVAGIRGFATVADHNAAWMDSCAGLKKNDQLWILGDLTGGGHIPEALNLLGMLPCELHLILGNHDAAHPMHRDSHRRQSVLFPTFASVQVHARKSIAGHRVLLSHFPFTGDTEGRDEDRDLQWRLPDLGTPILHGHTHSEFGRSVSALGTPQIHVGWDAWRQPMEANVLARLL
jgi:calcineurin-like phosphoesterase family protein